MARPLRIEYENAFYHVMNRGKGRQNLFHGTDYYQAFLQSIEEAHKRFGLGVHAYCLMSNHYHLLIKTPRGNLSRIMRHIDGLYTQRHNRLKKTDGSLFRGRYKAIVIDAASYLLQVSRYIHRNPIETKIPLVEQLEDYPWSSYSIYINLGMAPAWLNRDSVYAELTGTRRYQTYRNFVAQGNDHQTRRFYELKQTPAILGEQAFKERLKEKVVIKDKEITHTGLRQPVSQERVIQSVASYFQIQDNKITRTSRGRGLKNIPRWIAMKLCQETASAKLTDIATVFNVSHYSTVSQTIGRLNRLMEDDSRVLYDYNVLSQDLTP